MSDTQTTEADSGAQTTEGFDVNAYASQFGWKPKDQWVGDDANWTDAPEFLKHTFDKAKNQSATARKQLEEVNRVNAKLLEQATRKAEAAIARAERMVDEAAEGGDPQEIAAARQAERDAKFQAEAARAQAEFAKEQPWFGVNKRATRLAGMAVDEALEENPRLSVKQQFKVALEAVQEAMPELFGEEEADEADDEDQDEEPKAKLKAKKPPMVQGGTRTPPLRKGPKGWDDIPASARQAAEKAYKMNSENPMVSKKEYAETYWKEYGDN